MVNVKPAAIFIHDNVIKFLLTGTVQFWYKEFLLVKEKESRHGSVCEYFGIYRTLNYAMTL